MVCSCLYGCMCVCVCVCVCVYVSIMVVLCVFMGVFFFFCVSVFGWWGVWCGVCAGKGFAGVLVFTARNPEVQEAWRLVCLGKKGPSEDPPRAPQTAVRS